MKKAAKRISSTDILVGQNIRIYRAKKGLSQTELGEQLGITFQQIQKYEMGANRVSAGRLAQIAELLEVRLATLFGNFAPVGSSDDDTLMKIMANPHSVRLVLAFDRIRESAAKIAILQLLESIAGPANSKNARKHGSDR